MFSIYTYIFFFNEANKIIQSERLHSWYCRWEEFKNYAIEITSDGIMYIPSFMNISSGIQVILWLFERLQCWYYLWEGFMKHTVEMVSGGMTYIPSFIRISLGVQKLSGEIHILTYRHTH
jgi:hypothetical protein